MTARFLITTAEERTWQLDKPVLFLGEWCRLHARRDVWSGLDAEVVPYHWDDRAKLYADYLYLRELHERLLPELSEQLNRIHGVKGSLRYWRILIGPWLGYFAQMLFDRWESVQRAIHQHEISETIVLSGQDDALVPANMTAFARHFVTDGWNHHLFATILQRFTGVPCRKTQNSFGAQAWNAKAAPASGARQRIKQKLAGSYASFSGRLSRDRDAFFLATYLPLSEEMRMYRRFGQVPQLWQSMPAVETAVDNDRRQWTLGGVSRSQFEVCLRELIPLQIPPVYLEGYRRLVEQTEKLPWPRRPKVIWTSNSHTYDDVFKAWAAAKVEQGSPLVIGQHGGHYGIGRWSFLEEHDLAISDRYLSWGWSTPQEESKIEPVGHLQMKKPLSVRHSQQARALLVTCTLPRFSYWMYSSFLAGQWLNYFDDQCRFVSHLPRAIQDALTVRLFFRDYDWNQVVRWRERFPDLRLDSGESDINGLVRQSRLYISSYNATTYLESFSMDVPTVIYWNPAHWELRPSAIPDFEDLARVGIFHETPESAARHVAMIWDQVDAWWSSPVVREVLQRFKYRYCRAAHDLSDRIERAVRGVIA
jgi:putative transferase (TIGR04331 family)